MPNDAMRGLDPQIAPEIDREALYAKFRSFVEQVKTTNKWQDWFSAGDDTEGFMTALNGWFTAAEQAVLIEDAQALAPDQPPGALGYWIW